MSLFERLAAQAMRDHAALTPLAMVVEKEILGSSLPQVGRRLLNGV